MLITLKYALFADLRLLAPGVAHLSAGAGGDTIWDDRLGGGVFQMSNKVRRMRAVELAGASMSTSPTYTFRQVGAGDDAWKRVKGRAICELHPSEIGLMPEIVTFECVDGTKQYFNPDDEIELADN
jgi:hypothetical protein